MAGEEVLAAMREQQLEIVTEFERIEGTHKFRHDDWESSGGTGWIRIMEGGSVFERAGVNVSKIHGPRVPEKLARQWKVSEDSSFYATGLSMVIHPRNPYAPAFHANFRYFNFDDNSSWIFGGGADLTPCYGFEEDAVHFHQTLKDFCDRQESGLYDIAKKTCDEYFYLPHRKETRGVGGIFLHEYRPTGPDAWERGVQFIRDGLGAILPAYLPVIVRRKDTPYGENERNWQLYRRGRYVEFNLVYDQGTYFGLQTGGNTEAILISMPPQVSWGFKVSPEPGTMEALLIDFLRPRDWLALAAER